MSDIKPLVDLWECKGETWSLTEKVEGNSEVDGKIILGRVQGPMFVPNGTSENERFYPKSLWEKVLSNKELQDRLGKRLVYGKIGHEDKPVTEDDLEKGRVSHIITKMWIDESGKGMGEALILGTDAGRNLYTYLKAGSKLKPSTRANGRYLEGQTHEGMPIVDENNYIFETVDFVLTPGFKEVDTKLVENLNGKLKFKKPMNSEQENKVLSEMIESRVKLQGDLKTALDESKKARLTAKRLQESRDNYKNQLVESRKTISTLQQKGKAVCESATALQKKYNTLVKKYQAYKKLGECADIEQMQRDNQEYRNFFEGLKDPDTTAQRITKMAEELRRYREIGTPEQIERVATLCEKKLKEYKALGTPEEISRVTSQAEGLIRKFVAQGRRRELTAKVESCSKKYNLPVEDVRSIVESNMTGKNKKALLESMSSRKNNRVVQVSEKATKQPRSFADSVLCEGKSRACAVFRNMGGFNK